MKAEGNGEKFIVMLITIIIIIVIFVTIIIVVDPFVTIPSLPSHALVLKPFPHPPLPAILRL